METRSRKRKREVMQNPDTNPKSVHEISWDGEWLPTELWTKVFYYLLVPVPPVGLAYSTEHARTLQRHPLIAGIVNEFLQFRTGITFVELRGNTPYPDRRGTGRVSRRYWTPMNPKPTSMEYSHQYSIFEILVRLPTDDRYFRYVSVSGLEILFLPDSISIHLGFLEPISFKNPKTKSGHAKFGELDRHKIRVANRVLPYGLHIHQDRGVLQIRMPNNPRLDGPKFRIVREFHCVCMTERGVTKIGYDVYCNISLDKLYIPTWRPYS